MGEFYLFMCHLKLCVCLFVCLFVIRKVVTFDPNNTRFTQKIDGCKGRVIGNI